MLPVVVDALEAGDDRDRRRAPSAVAQRARRRCGAMRARPKALSVSMRIWWPRNDRAGTPSSCERDRGQRRRHLLAGGREHVDLALVGSRMGRLGELEQPVGLARHRRDDDHHRVPGARVRAARPATFRMRSMSPTDVPPNFCTMSATPAPQVPRAIGAGDRDRGPGAASRIDRLSPAPARREAGSHPPAAGSSRSNHSTAAVRAPWSITLQIAHPPAGAQAGLRAVSARRAPAGPPRRSRGVARTTRRAPLRAWPTSGGSRAADSCGARTRGSARRRSRGAAGGRSS